MYSSSRKSLNSVNASPPPPACADASDTMAIMMKAATMSSHFGGFWTALSLEPEVIDLREISMFLLL
ncbi:hypothetical protein D3C72_2579880 [compost metagenome]